MWKLSQISMALSGVLLLLPTSAHAYLDPGSGSMLIQGAIAAIAAGAFTIKTYWYRIKAYFKREKYSPDVIPSDMTDEESVKSSE